jgi:hypothetical protein
VRSMRAAPSFIAGGLGGKLGRERANGLFARVGNPGARGNFPVRSPACYCCPVEAFHGAAPTREDEPRGGFLGRRVGCSVRPKRTRGHVPLSECSCGHPNNPKRTAQRVHLDRSVGYALTSAVSYQQDDHIIHVRFVTKAIHLSSTCHWRFSDSELCGYFSSSKCTET